MMQRVPRRALAIQTLAVLALCALAVGNVSADFEKDNLLATEIPKDILLARPQSGFHCDPLMVTLALLRTEQDFESSVGYLTVGTGLLNPHTGREIVTKTNQLNKCIDVATIPRIAKQIGSFWSKLKSFKLNGVSQPIEKGFFSPSELSRRITAATITRQVGLKAIKRVSQVIVEAKWTTKWSLRPVPDLSRPGDAQPESRTAATTSVTATAEQQASSSDNEVASNPTTTAAVTPAVASAVGTGSFPTVLETVESGVITFSPVYCLPSSIAITTDADVWGSTMARLEQHEEVIRSASFQALEKVQSNAARVMDSMKDFIPIKPPAPVPSAPTPSSAPTAVAQPKSVQQVKHDEL